MAFAIKRREQKKSKDDFGLLDAAMMQELQEHFCDANSLYLACLSVKYGVVTKAYGSKEELAYLHSKVSMDMHVALLNHLMNSNIESVVEMNCQQTLTKMCGVAIRIEGEIEAIWIAIGVMEDAAEEIPSYMQVTSEDRFYKSIEFLETLSKQLFAVKLEERMAQEAFLASRASENKMEAELHRSEVMTSIVKMLESENDFTKIVDDVLEIVVEYLGISDGALLRENAKGDMVDLVCEYSKTNEVSVFDQSQGIAKALVPFFNGKPYMISSNSMMPEEFHLFFDRTRIQAGVFLPITINDKVGMYLCFFERSQSKIWDVSEIKFMNDVKRIIQSILIKRIAKNSLATSYASLEAILENVGCGIYVRNPHNGQMLYANQKFTESFKRMVEDGSMDYYITATLETKGHHKEFYFEKEALWTDIRCTSIKWVDGKEVQLCTFFDISDIKEYEQEIEKRENHDMLTGLYNRIRCEHDVEQCIHSAIEVGAEGALLYLDLDDFKHINDGLGHHYGDALLQSIAKELVSIPSLENSCYRVGGDEFAIIVHQHHYPMLYMIIEDIKEVFAKPWMLKGTEYYCTMSMSVVRFPTDADNFEELVKKADAALFDIKNTGKNRVTYYDEEIDTGSYKRLDLEKHMRNAVYNNMDEFEVFYQPVVDATQANNPCIGAEALVRWNSKELGYVSPGDFISLAEYLGLINPIGEHVLRQACTRCRYWNDMGQPDFTVNVNLSVIQLLDPEIVNIIRRAIEDTGIIPDHLHLEVTEGLAVNDMSRMKQILAEIKALGVKVALDDFGTGYSSLNHIREMPIDIIKIDRCFINDLGKDEFSDAFVKMVTQLSSAIGVITCVEGVEEANQVEILKNMNVRLIQGFFFGRPMRVEDFEAKYL